MENCNNRQAESTLTVNELKEAFFLLKIKALVMMTCCQKLFWPLTKAVNGYVQYPSSKTLFSGKP